MQLEGWGEAGPLKFAELSEGINEQVHLIASVTPFLIILPVSGISALGQYFYLVGRY